MIFSIFHYPGKELQHGMGFCLEINISKMCIDGMNRDVKIAGDSFTTFGLDDQTYYFFFPGCKHGISFLYINSPGFVNINES